MANQIQLTTGDVARHYGVATWQVRRLFESGRLPEPETRAGQYRLVSADDLPRVGEALAEAGYLKADKTDAPTSRVEKK